MLCRNIIFVVILGLLLTRPMHGEAWREDPCLKLARGLRLLGAEDIYYRGTHFICTKGAEEDQLIRKIITARPADKSISADWRLGRGLDESYMVLQVSGWDYRECRELADSLIYALGPEQRLIGQTWQLECYLKGKTGDLARLGQSLVYKLGGDIYSIQAYNQSVHLLAYLPWPGEKLMLEDGPVNLDLELLFEPANSTVRLRIGNPVLLTLAYFHEPK